MAIKRSLLILLLPALALAQVTFGPMLKLGAQDKALFPVKTSGALYRGSLMYDIDAGYANLSDGVTWQNTSDWLGFEFAPLDGGGMGTECACVVPTGARGEVMTFTRTSVVECYSNDGQVLTQCPANRPAISSGSADSGVLGLWAERAVVNNIKRSRDLRPVTDGGVNVWVSVGMTCTVGIGMRPDGGGGSYCVASADGGSILQTFTSATLYNLNQSFHVRTDPDAGPSYMGVFNNRDGGWLDITSAVAPRWQRVVAAEMPGCTGGNCIVVPEVAFTKANGFSTGFALGPNDAVHVDFFQIELEFRATTPIETLDAVVTRTASSASFLVRPSFDWIPRGCSKATFMSQLVPPILGVGETTIENRLLSFPAAGIVYYYGGIFLADVPGYIYFTSPSRPGVWESAMATWGTAAQPTKMTISSSTRGMSLTGAFDGVMDTPWASGGGAYIGQTFEGVIKQVSISNDPTWCISR